MSPKKKETMVLRELKIEIISQCSLNCIHCSSNSTPATREGAPSKAWLRIINEARELGAEKLAISGGEPLLHSDLEQIAEFAKGLGLTTVVYTTGNAADAEKIIERLARLKTDKLIFSIFGENAKTHERVTRISGSYESTLESIEMAVEKGITCELHFVPLKFNFREINEIVVLGEKLGAKATSVLRFVPQGRGSTITGEKLNKIENLELARRIRNLRSAGYCIRTGSPYNFLFLNNHPVCMAGIDRIIISPDLHVYPCDAFKQIKSEEIAGSDDLSSIDGIPLVELWAKSPYLLAIRQYLCTKFEEPCSSCKSLDNCKSGCLAQKVIANGSLLKNADPDCIMIHEGN